MPQDNKEKRENSNLVEIKEKETSEPAEIVDKAVSSFLKLDPHSKEETDIKIDFIRKMKEEGLDEDAMLDRYCEKYWDPDMEEVQPKDAFIINSKAIIKAFLKAL